MPFNSKSPQAAAVMFLFLMAQATAADQPPPANAAPPAAAQVTTPVTTPVTTQVAPEKPTETIPDVQLTPEEKAEKESRKACKADICSALRAKKSDGPDVSCAVTKSWRKEQLGKLVGKLKVSWPYGPVKCTSMVNLKRADLVKAVTADKIEIELDKHAVACVVDREKEPASDIKFDFTPKVSFENGKATKAKINWGKIEAPTLIKGALWTATAADNTVNMLSGTLVADINDFIDKKCDEVKDQWAGK